MNKKIIIIGVLLVALVVIVACVAVAFLGGGDSYASKLEKGYAYLREGDYDNAILQFRYAIDEDCTREEAYEGLYYAYLYSGQDELAVTALRVGISATNSTNLQKLLVTLDNSVSDNTTNNDDNSGNQNNQTVDKNITPVLNTELLSIFASANYGDYCMKYGSEMGTMSSGQYTRYLSAIGATLVYFDTEEKNVLDTSRGVPYSEYVPNQIHMDNITSLFGGGNLSFGMLKAMGGVSNLAMSDNTITFTYSDCEVTIITGDDGLITASCENKLVPADDIVQTETAYNVSATVVDATSNSPITGAQIKVYKGYNTNGRPVEGTTDGAGKLNLELEKSGNYTVVVEKDGYITEQFELVIMSSVYSYNETFLLSPAMSGDTIRFVLSWGASPSDLDSHLSGTASDGSSIHTRYSRKQDYNYAGDMVSELDVDDTTAYGPETVTLYDAAGSYEFFVDDFTNSGTISNSGATVKIYVGSTLYATVTIPAGIEDRWHVCTVNNGVITVTNRSY